MDRKQLEKRSVADLREIARKRLLVVSTKDMKLQGELKRRLVEAILENKRDYSKLKLDRLRDYIRENHLLMPPEDASKEQYITIIEGNIKPEEKKQPQTQEKQHRTDRNLWENIMIRVHPSVLFRICGLWSTARGIVNEVYWYRRCRLEGIPLDWSKFDLSWELYRTTWKLWYLEWNNFPIAGERLVAWGDNWAGQLGFVSKKIHINQATEVDLHGVVDVETSHDRTLFVCVDGTVWSCGNGPMGWSKEFAQLEKKTRRSPHPIELVSNAKQCFDSGSYIIVLTRKGELMILDFDPTTGTVDYKKLSEKRYCAVFEDRYMQKNAFVAVTTEGNSERYHSVGFNSLQMTPELIEVVPTTRMPGTDFRRERSQLVINYVSFERTYSRSIVY